MKTLISFSLIFFLVSCIGFSFAQTAINTNHPNNNGNGMVLFHIKNDNAFPVVIREFRCHLGTTATNNVSLLYCVTPKVDSATPWNLGVVGAGQNDWIEVASGTIASNTADGIVPVFTAMTLTIPANTTYGFAFSASTLQYSSLTNGAGVNTFSGGSVSILTGDGISWGGVAAPATPANYPRGLIGGITWYGISVLKIDLGTFAAKNDGTKNKLSWNSLSEAASDIYEIERSTDGKNFTKVGSIAAKGAASNYVFYDENPSLGLNYYRLKLKEANGDFQYSQLSYANVKNLTEFNVTVYPNPVTDKIFGKVNGTSSKGGSIKLLDVNRKLLKETSVSNSEFTLVTKELPTGLYILNYVDELNNSYSHKLIKK